MAMCGKRQLVNAAITLANFMLILVAGCVMVVAVLMLQHTELLHGYLKPMMQVLPSGNGFQVTIYDMYNGSVYSFFVFGGIACIIGCTGCSIAHCRSRPVVVVYLLSLSVLMVGQITGAILLAAMDVGEDLSYNLFRHLVTHYAGDNASDSQNVAWKYAMSEFSCCGARSYEDFEATTLWNRAEFVEGNLTTALIPVACCKLPGKYPDIGSPIYDNCTYYPTLESSYFMTPCRGKIEDYLNYYQLLMVLSSATLGLMEILAMGSVILACREMTRKNRAQEKQKQRDEMKANILSPSANNFN